MPIFRRHSTAPQSPPESVPPPNTYPAFEPPTWLPNLNEFDIYHLRQTSRNTQTLTPGQSSSTFLPTYTPSVNLSSEPPAPPTYSIKIRPTSTFIKSKSDMTISRRPSFPEPTNTLTPATVAEVRFDRTTSRTLITYPASTSSPPKVQEMNVESCLAQKHSVVIDSQLCTWAPLQRDMKRCLELRSGENILLACLTWTKESKKLWQVADKDAEVGVLQVYQGVGERVAEEVVCSAVALVEEGRRRILKIGPNIGPKRDLWADIG